MWMIKRDDIRTAWVFRTRSAQLQALKEMGNVRKWDAGTIAAWDLPIQAQTHRIIGPED